MTFILEAGPFRWQGIQLVVNARGHGVTKQVLFAGDDVDVRYFEVAPGGHTALEHHEHTHRVMVLRGRGTCLVDTEVHVLAPRDIVFMPSWAWHQFRAAGEESLGFLCIVPAQRDAGVAPDSSDLACLLAIPAVADFLERSAV